MKFDRFNIKQLPILFSLVGAGVFGLQSVTLAVSPVEISRNSNYIERASERANADYYFKRASERFDNKDYNGAIEDYNQAIILNPQQAVSYYNRGLSYQTLGKTQQAIEDYTKAIAINPQYTEAYNNRGNAFDDLGMHQMAIADYNRAIAIAPQDGDLYYNLGISYYNIGEKQKAVASWRKAAEIYQRQAKDKDYRDAIELIQQYS